MTNYDELEAELRRIRERLAELDTQQASTEPEPEPTAEERNAEALAKKLGEVADGSWLSFPA